MSFKIQMILCFIIGCIMAYSGLDFHTWQYWIIGIALALSYQLGKFDQDS